MAKTMKEHNASLIKLINQDKVLPVTKGDVKVGKPKKKEKMK